MKPLVSILMTVYNREIFIIEAIESVLANNYSNWELIITDDCSSDNSFAIAKGFAEKNDKIKLFKNEENLGDYPNRNKAASLAKGEFIMYVDSDDKLNADTINNILYSDEIVKCLNFAMYWPHSADTFSLPGDKAIRKHFFEKQFLYMGPGGTFIRKSFYESIGGYPVKYGPANDMFFNLKACCYSDIYLYPFEFIYYRIHDGQEINNKDSYIFYGYNYMRDALNCLPLPITENERKFLLKKNKRRFVVNLYRQLLFSKNLKQVIIGWKNASFSFIDFLQGLFHLNLKKYK